MKKILVLNGMSYAAAIRGLGAITYDAGEFMAAPEEFCMVLFTGGEDVDPAYYGETSPQGICYYNTARDKQELAVFEVAAKHGIVMSGICRGLQFLNVMAGGRLMHHITGHNGGIHEMTVRAGRRNIRVNSLHHQMVIPHDGAQIIGVTTRKQSREYISVSDLPIEYRGAEVEAAVFPAIRAFGVQYHPEMMDHNTEGYLYFYNMVKNSLSIDWAKFVTAYVEGVADVELFEICSDDSATSR